LKWGGGEHRGQARDEVQRVQHDGVRTRAPSAFEPIHDLARVRDLETFLANRWTRHVATDSLESLAITTVDHRTNMHVHAADFGEGLVG